MAKTTANERQEQAPQTQPSLRIAVAVVAPTRRELGGWRSSNPEARSSVVGIGRIAEPRVRSLLSQASCSLILSLGYAGALDGDLRSGDIVVADTPDAPLTDDSQSPAAAHDPAEAVRLLRRVGLSASSGPILTVGEPLLTAAAKRQARGRQRSQSVVDMEARWIAYAAAAHGVPLLSVRAVLDETDFELPAFVGNIVADGGRREWLHTARALADPHALKRIVPLAQRSRAASRALRRVADCLIPTLICSGSAMNRVLVTGASGFIGRHVVKCSRTPWLRRLRHGARLPQVLRSGPCARPPGRCSRLARRPLRDGGVR